MNNRILVLRNCHADMTSHNGFIYPTSGMVEAPDWEPTYQCGHGLHGQPWGEMSIGYFYNDTNAKWLVISVLPDDGYLCGKGDMQDKCKFRRGEVVFCGDRADAVQYILDNGGMGRAVCWSTLTGGDGSTLTGGDGSTLTGGDGSTLTGGDRSIIQLKYWDGKRQRIVTGYIGENGLKPGVAYKLNDIQEFIEA